MTNLRWKVVTILGVFIIFCAVGVYPIAAQRYNIKEPSWLVDKALKLGLDLKGGVHLVLRVQTEDALRVETESSLERLREQLTTNNVGTTAMTVVSPTEFRVEGVKPEQDSAFRDSLSVTGIETNYD